MQPRNRENKTKSLPQSEIMSTSCCVSLKVSSHKREGGREGEEDRKLNESLLSLLVVIRPLGVIKFGQFCGDVNIR